MKNWIGFVAFFLCFISCQKATLYEQGDDVSCLDFETGAVGGGELVLGKKLQNPYSVENMRKAYLLLVPGTRSDYEAESVIPVTHRYLKFFPHNGEEFAFLKRDTALVLYHYPLDYEILNYGFYHDPDVDVDEPTPMYCSVPVGKNLPAGVDYEVLEELFIPEEMDDAPTRSRSLSVEFLESLVRKSFEITGNDYGDGGTRGSGSSWVPQGCIKYLDTSMDSWRDTYVPVEGIEVRCHRWFTTYKAYTNANGVFKCKNNQTFSGKATYSLNFERYDFEIRDGKFSTPSYEKSDLTGPWRPIIKDNWGRYFIDIFRAAYKYYYQDIHGISRPPLNGFLVNKMSIRGFPDISTDGRAGGSFSISRGKLGIDSEIYIYCGGNKISDSEIFGATIHELAHAAHYSSCPSEYLAAKGEDIFVLESWATGVSLYLCRDIYEKFSVFYTYSLGRYGGVVQDLIDGSLNESIFKDCQYWYDKSGTKYYFSPSKEYWDKACGYTLSQIEQSLVGARTGIQWKNNLKSKFNNPTEQYVDEVFDFWMNPPSYYDPDSWHVADQDGF